MSEQFHPERPDQIALAAERSEVCDTACAERVALNAELSPEQLRTGELVAYIAEHYPDCAQLEQAAGACFEREAQMRGFMGDSFDLTQPQNAGVMDITVGEFVQRTVRSETMEMAETEQVAVTETLNTRNEEATAVLAAAERTGIEVPEVPAVRAASTLRADTTAMVATTSSLTESRETVAEPALLRMETQAARDLTLAESQRSIAYSADIESSETESRLAEEDASLTAEKLEMRELEAAYHLLREEGATQKVALQQLLTRTNIPANTDFITQILGNISALENALPPERRDVVSRLIESSNLDLGAANSAAVFADFFASAEASEDLSDEEVATLRQVLGGTPEVETATDARDALASGRGTETLPDGTTHTIPYTEAAPLALAEGVEAFPNPDNPDNMLIKAQFSDAVLGQREYTFNVPATMSGAAATEQINFFYINAIKESCGITGGTQQGQFVTQGEQQIDLSTDGLMTQAARFGRITMDELVGGIGNEAQFLDSAQIEQIRWSYQWFMPRNEVSGDAAFGDNSEVARAEAFGGLGRDGLIFDANGTLKEENFRRAAAYINGQRSMGATEPSYEALRAYLEGDQVQPMA